MQLPFHTHVRLVFMTCWLPVYNKIMIKPGKISNFDMKKRESLPVNKSHIIHVHMYGPHWLVIEHKSISIEQPLFKIQENE